MTGFAGRQRERQFLRLALEGRESKLLIVRGPSGVGKTALIEHALHDIAQTQPILGRAKYAEQAVSTGLRPVVDALSQAVDAALGRLYDPASGAASLRKLLGVQYGTLVAAGFDAGGLTRGAAPPATTALLSHEGTVRLIDALVRVLQWLEGFALPVVLFIDDWHRAPNEAVGFVHACSQRGETSQLKLVLAARGEGAAAYPATASILQLAPLGANQQFELLTGLLGNPGRAQAMMDWLGDGSSGLPFDLCQIALALERTRAFVGTGEAHRIDLARAAAIDHRDVNRLIVQRARALPPEILRLGIAAALWGDRAPLDRLGSCLALSLAATRSAAEILQANGLLRLEGEEIAFPHDRIRTSLLEVPQRAELIALAHAMADVVLSGNAGAHTQTALRLKLLGGLEEVRDARLAALFAAESASARLAAQFDLAADFGEAAWSIFQRVADPDRGQRLSVLREACFAAAHNRQVETTRQRCVQMIAATVDDAEAADAYERSVIAMRVTGTSADAWVFCREGLARFGVRLPDRVGHLHIVLASIVWRLVGRKARRMLRHDARTEQALASFASSAGYTVWERSPRHVAYMSIQLAIRARLMGYNSALWLSADALIAAVLKDYRAAAAFGDQALASLEELQVGRGSTLHRAVYFGKMWRDPRASLIDSNRRIYDLCIVESDLISAANALLNEAVWTWRSAPTLEEVAAKLVDCDSKAVRLGATRAIAEMALLAELVQRLRRPEPLSSSLLDKFIAGKIDDPPMVAVEYLSLVEDWPAILRIAAACRNKRHTLDSHPVGVSWRFHDNLARLKTGLPLDRSDLRFIERAARANPTDQLGKLLLLRAERSYRRGEKDCLLGYAAAVEAMRSGSSRLELGLAAECASVAARELGDKAAHERFRDVAVTTWSTWGALGKLAMYHVTQLDASIRAQLAEAEAQSAMAQRGERAKSRFLAEVGHELRTPMQAIQGLLDLAAERPGEIDVGEIREVFGSLRTVVDDLIELGALGAEAPLNLRPTDLASLLGSELALVHESARQKGLLLSSDLVGVHGQYFELDPHRLRQVVRNLLSNAVKYTDHGNVVLRATVDDGSGAMVRLAVEDTGPGIPEERLSHLFEPFDRAGRQDAKGLGLGLLLSRRIAERMGGSLTAENRPTGGTRFVLSFAANPAASALPPKVPQTIGRRLTILIVEDTSLVRRLMVRLLGNDGHELIEAETLAQGLEMARRHSFDLLLLDLHLPDGDGLSLVERWPLERRRPPVIVLTAAATRETEDRVTHAGGTVLRKPIAAADLRTAIVRACGDMEAVSARDDFEAEMARLAREANQEISKRTSELIDLVESNHPRMEIQKHAHKLAGLASQFGAPSIAHAVDGIEWACANGTPPAEGLAALKRALVESDGG
ncbi:ATP-binding protein [Reyranella sp.]|uniref:ATP-binding protein n=1 Tax=Reyranella sp. TaxID=1929291 RepID=UPI00272114C0|nr:ATP-binding protein [Reyranella sp.]MDO8975981.1 ATP-binding protein [Reyranella sp.]